IARMAPRLRLGKVLVSVQVALSVLLVTGAGLLLQTVVNLYRVDTGFDMENLLVFRLNPAQAGHKGRELVDCYERVREAISSLPGVHSVALSSITLLSGSSTSYAITIPGRPTDEHFQPNQMIISDGFFSTMGIGLLSGRDFNQADDQGSAPVAIVNQNFCKSFFPDDDCLGKTFNVGGTVYQIVGLCCNARYDDLRGEAPPIMYFPYRQRPEDRMTFEVRAVLPAMSLVPAVRRLVARIDNNLPLENVATQQQVVRNRFVPERLFAGLCGVLAFLALLLSSIGLHGLMAYDVERRIPEMGIRLALGARPKDVAWSIVCQALILATIGIMIGIPAALALARLARSAFFGIEPHDPMTFALSIILLLGVAVFAAWMPAHRASKTDPMEALRYE
ncbi:MAG: FtsX-like permease family protein, partial [Sedimentisphaerales bacterium]|nr:FtsX-like permease family protein [Sedimentisphaerales bacterium]